MLRRNLILSSSLLILPTVTFAKPRTSKEEQALFDISIVSITLSSEFFTREQLNEKIKELKNALPHVKDKELKTETRKLIAKAQTILLSSYVSNTQMREMNEQANLVDALSQEVRNRK